MRAKLLFDELNILRQDLNTEAQRLDEVVDETIDTVLDLLIMAYVFGNKDTNENLNTERKVDKDKMNEAIFRKFEDKDFADRIAEYAKEKDVEGIMRVAETEIHRDYSAGAYDAAQGLDVNKTWVTMADNRVRDTHFYLEGVKIGLNEKFYTFDGDSAQYPGDFSKTQNNANCRCVISITKKA